MNLYIFIIVIIVLFLCLKFRYFWIETALLAMMGCCLTGIMFTDLDKGNVDLMMSLNDGINLMVAVEEKEKVG